MTQKPTILAINGSPHSGIGNTGLMIEMLRNPLAAAGFELDVIALCDHEIEFCTGCAVCMEKGKCWIPDDHRHIIRRLLAADGVILASPVYFFHVTAQMKTFLDRSLAFGHKPRSTWKPGLAISVSAGKGETQTADYLANSLRVYGAYSVGTLTAMAVSPGEFVGTQIVQQRAADLANDLAVAVKKKRRYPATDIDLAFYQFMGNLVRSRKDGIMKDDYLHWRQSGLFENFEAYIGQDTAKTQYDPQVRKAWAKEMIGDYKTKKDRGQSKMANTADHAPGRADTCEELIRSMPQGFNAAGVGDLEAVYQFEINGQENFCGYLKIENQKCSYHEGTAESPTVKISAPSDVWLAISAGEMDGQQAFMSGRYKAEGDIGLLMKMRNLFPG